jgi:hypothetical protein
MIGNFSEWVADWDEEAIGVIGCTTWPSGFGSDTTCLGRGEGELSTRFPGALVRGGSYTSAGTDAGPFTVVGFHRPSAAGGDIGFRGAR